MSYLSNYLPEYDDEERRAKYGTYPIEDLIEMLIRKEKESRVLAKMVDERDGKLNRIREILDEPSMLVEMSRPIRWD